jgi:hypothetical protein
MDTSDDRNGDDTVNDRNGDGDINQDDDEEAEVLTVRVPTDHPWDPRPWVDHFIERYRGKIVGKPLRIELEYWFDQMLWAYEVYFRSTVSGSDGEDRPDQGAAVCESCSALVSSTEAHEAWHLRMLEHR